MCGRYKLDAPQIAFQFIDVDIDPDQVGIVARHNIRPTQRVHALTAPHRLQEMKWGLSVVWSNAPLINAQSESVRNKKTFRESFESHRCLLPADGFYEWIKGSKRPHLLTVDGGAPFTLGAFWNEPLPVGNDTPADPARCCILTTQPNEILTPIHNRMPVIIRKEDWEQWLEPGPLDDQAFQRLTAPYDPKAMTAREIDALNPKAP